MVNLNEKIDKVMHALQRMPENDVSNNVIIPLLKYIGYNNVEFYGGTNEEGKDIVFWENTKLGIKKLCVAQVKHFKLSNKASGNDSFQTVVNQLIMCFEKRLIFTDKQPYKPKEAFLISTFPIDIKTMQTRFSETPSIQSNNIEIIDGEKLASLLIEHEQPIVKTILGNEVDFTSYFSDSINNRILLKALGFTGNIVLKKIYTDIDFSIGKTTTELFFHSKMRGDTVSLNLTKSEWGAFRNSVKFAESHFGADYIDPLIEQIEENYNIQFEKNKLIEFRIKEIENELKKENKSILNNKKELNEIATNELDDDSQTRDSFENKKRKNKILKDEINMLKESLIDITYDFILIGGNLSNLLKEKRKKIEVKVGIFNKKTPSLHELKEFIEECKETIECSSKLLKNNIIANNLFDSESRKTKFRKDLEKTRFKLPIEKIFDTGLNIILLGEAGAGKTTCLQMYALNKEKDLKRLIVWAPLANVLQNWNSINNKPRENDESLEKVKIDNFETAIFEYLVSKKVDLEITEFKNIFTVRNSTLLLDGIDEAIKNNPWLPKAIVRLTETFPKAQIILTSRFSGKYVDEIPFFSTTLLPFTDKQRDEFINKWFEDGNYENVEKIKDHLLKNESISNITRNPLLTTTLCVIAKHNLPLPQTEIRLYNDRLRLLTGYYDNVKNIETRITITPQNLELLAQKLAFYLHSNGLRQIEISTLRKKAIKIMRNVLIANDAKKAINELIDPCNILIPMTSDGKYGFGHLRYQEHLTALELKTNRSIDVERLMTVGWWFDTLILFAQMNENLDWLINKISYQIEIKEIRQTFFTMLKTRPINEQQLIKRKIEKLIKERKELFLVEDELDLDISME